MRAFFLFSFVAFTINVSAHSECTGDNHLGDLSAKSQDDVKIKRSLSDLSPVKSSTPVDSSVKKVQDVLDSLKVLTIPRIDISADRINGNTEALDQVVYYMKQNIPVILTNVGLWSSEEAQAPGVNQSINNILQNWPADRRNDYFLGEALGRGAHSGYQPAWEWPWPGKSSCYNSYFFKDSSCYDSYLFIHSYSFLIITNISCRDSHFFMLITNTSCYDSYAQ